MNETYYIGQIVHSYRQTMMQIFIYKNRTKDWGLLKLTINYNERPKIF